MRKLSFAVTGTFVIAVGLGQIGSGVAHVGVETKLLNPGTIEIVKVVDGDLPAGTADWKFTVTSTNCGESIDDGDSGVTDERTVEIAAGGGHTTVLVESNTNFQPSVVTPCEYAVVETPVAGWTTNPASYTGVTVLPQGTAMVTFTNTPQPTPTIVIPTTAAPTTAAPTTAAPTTPAPTTAAPTTEPAEAGAGGALPGTGNDHSGSLALAAAVTIALGGAALWLSRRRLPSR